MAGNPKHKGSLHSVAISSSCLNQILTRKIRGRTGNQRKSLIIEASVYEVTSTGLKPCLIPQPVPNMGNDRKLSHTRIQAKIHCFSKQKQMPYPDTEKKTLLSSQTQAKIQWCYENIQAKKQPSATVGEGEGKVLGQGSCTNNNRNVLLQGRKRIFLPKTNHKCMTVFDHPGKRKQES